MKSIFVIAIALALGMLIACSSSQDKAYNAQRKVSEERLKLVDEYKKCVKKAGEDQDKIEACDKYLRAAEALK